MARLIWRWRGRLAAGLSALLVFAVIGLAVRSTWATSGGTPYTVPLVVDVNPDPDIIETTIVAEPALVDIGNGVFASVLTFNGSIPGPEFRLNVGDTVIVHFKNNIAHHTGIHWHGIELNNASDGTPLSQNQVAPGGEFLYKFKVVRPGIYWYHPHHHSSTNQVFKGMYGSMIVTDPAEAAIEAAGVIPALADSRTLVLSDITVCKSVGSNDGATFDPSLPHASGGPLPDQPAPFPVTLCEDSPLDEDGNPRGPYAAGDVPNIQRTGPSGPVNEGQVVLTNGVNAGGRSGTPESPGLLAPGASVLDVTGGQGLRLHLVNAATTRFFRLRLTDDAGTQIPLVRVGGQGGLLDNAVVEGGVVGGFDFKYGTGEILLDPGDRADVVAAIPSSASGVLTLWTLDFERTGIGFAKIPTVPVAHFNVAGAGGSPYTIAAGTPLRASVPGAAVDALGPPTATLLDPAAFSPPKAGLASQDVKLTNNSGISPLGIDDVQGTHDFPGDYTAVPHEASARYAAEIGDTLELSVTNVTGAHHPFHLHGFSIQPIELTKSGSPSYTFPYREFRDNIDVPAQHTLRFRVRLDDRTLMDGTTLGGGLGRWVFHCHIFFHATFGMISEFVVVSPDGRERPYVNTNGTLIEALTGQTVQMAGTYVDTDGDAVTLSASVGTVEPSGGNWGWTHTTTASDPEFVYITATDAGGRKDQVAFALKVNKPPVVTVDNASGSEGAPIAIHATAVDPEGESVVAAWSWAAGAGTDPGAACVIANAAALDTTITCNDDGAFVITLTASDGVNQPASESATVTVSNVAPTIAIVDPPSGSVYTKGTTVSIAASVADPGSNDELTCMFNWDGGGPPTASTAVGASCSGLNTFSSSGVYTLTVSVADDDGGGMAVNHVIVISDHSAKVTGTGLVASPAGSYPAKPSSHGAAAFAVTALYPPGASSPSGLITYRVVLFGFAFTSTSLDWIAVTNKTAQISGTGVIAGRPGTFRFLLTAADGKVLLGLLGGKLRLKVWDPSAGGAVIYDNVPGAPDDLDVANPRRISAGTIVVLRAP